MSASLPTIATKPNLSLLYLYFYIWKSNYCSLSDNCISLLAVMIITVFCKQNHFKLRLNYVIMLSALTYDKWNAEYTGEWQA